MDAIPNTTLKLALMSLDAYMARHQVLAHNIANASTPGFRPMSLDFESQLGALKAATAEGASDAQLAKLIDQVSPQAVERTAQGAWGEADAKTRLDEEITLLVQNTMQYEALLSALGRNGSIMRAAVTGTAS